MRRQPCGLVLRKNADNSSPRLRDVVAQLGMNSRCACSSVDSCLDDYPRLAFRQILLRAGAPVIPSALATTIVPGGICDERLLEELTAKALPFIRRDGSTDAEDVHGSGRAASASIVAAGIASGASAATLVGRGPTRRLRFEAPAPAGD